MHVSSITLNGVGKRYGDVTVLADVDLRIGDGEFLVLLGASGSGKSTTLRLVAGLDDLSEGTVAFGDRVLSTSDRTVPANKRQIGFVFQSYALWPHLTVLQNVVYPLRARGVPRSDARAQALESLDRVQLAGLADRPIGALSGGQQQRVALARATVGAPRIILFDEPLSNLDTQLRSELRAQIRALHDELKFTALYVTHDHAEALALADRIAVFRDGRIVQLDTAHEVFARPMDEFVARFLGFDVFVPATVAEVRPAGYTLAGVWGVSGVVPGASGLEPGDPVRVAIRSGSVELTPHPRGTDAGSLTGVLSAPVFEGNGFVATADVGGLALRGVLPLTAWGADPVEEAERVGHRAHVGIVWGAAYAWREERTAHAQ